MIAAFAGQQLSGQQEAVAWEAVGEQSEVADAHEASGQHVEEEAAQELCSRKRHDALLAAMGIVFPAQADALSVEGQQAVIGNGDAMGVAAQVAEHMCGSAEGRLGIHDPLLFAQLVQQFCEQFPILKHSGGTTAVQRSVAVEALEREEELVAKDAAEHRNGQQEAGMGMDPGLVVGGESSGGDDTVDMRVEQEVGTPAVQDGDEADLGARRFGSAATSNKVWELAANSRS